MKINSKNKVNDNNNTNNKKKTHSANDDCYHHYHYNKKNIIFSIRNNELTHYMSIFVISLIRDRTKTRAEATLDTSADKSLYGGQLRNHPKLIKSNYRTVPPSDTAIPSTPPPPTDTAPQFV